MEFHTLVAQIIEETSVAGGAGSVFGSNVGSTSTEFSGDNYASGDSRTPKSLYGGVLTRNGLKKKKKKTKKND